jgi:PPOX class probable F420-dependent enzyme
MPVEIPDDIRALISEPLFFHVATLNPDGSPQISVVWGGLDGDRFVFSTAEGRAKPRNLRNDPRIAVSFSPPDNPYRNVVLNGRAVVIENRGMGLIDAMARKYTEHDSYPWSQPGEVRVDVEIEIDRISG